MKRRSAGIRATSEKAEIYAASQVDNLTLLHGVRRFLHQWASGFATERTESNDVWHRWCV